LYLNFFLIIQDFINKYLKTVLGFKIFNLVTSLIFKQFSKIVKIQNYLISVFFIIKR